MEEDGAARSTRGGAANSFLKSRDLQEHLRFKYGVELCTPTRPQICKNWERKARNSCKWCWFPQQGPVRIQPAALARGGGVDPTAPSHGAAGEESLAGADAEVGTADRSCLPTSPGWQRPGQCQSQPGVCRLCAIGKQPRVGLQGDAGAGRGPGDEERAAWSGAATPQRAVAALCSLEHRVHPRTPKQKK